MDQREQCYKEPLSSKLRKDYEIHLKGKWKKFELNLKDKGYLGAITVDKKEIDDFILMKLKEEKFTVTPIQEERNSPVTGYKISWI